MEEDRGERNNIRRKNGKVKQTSIVTYYRSTDIRYRQGTERSLPQDKVRTELPQNRNAGNCPRTATQKIQMLPKEGTGSSIGTQNNGILRNSPQDKNTGTCSNIITQIRSQRKITEFGKAENIGKESEKVLDIVKEEKVRIE